MPLALFSALVPPDLSPRLHNLPPVVIIHQLVVPAPWHLPVMRGDAGPRSQASPRVREPVQDQSTDGVGGGGGYWLSASPIEGMEGGERERGREGERREKLLCDTVFSFRLHPMQTLSVLASPSCLPFTVLIKKGTPKAF